MKNSQSIIIIQSRGQCTELNEKSLLSNTTEVHTHKHGTFSANSLCNITKHKVRHTVGIHDNNIGTEKHKRGHVHSQCEYCVHLKTKLLESSLYRALLKDGTDGFQDSSWPKVIRWEWAPGRGTVPNRH